MLVIGLTGGIGSGKSTVAKYFSDLGVEIIDTDQLARQVVSPDTEGLHKIIEHFGKDILNPQQQLDRKKLRDIIFENEKERTWLENLLHPLIRAEVQQAVTKVKSPYCIVVIPLLVETKPNPLINRVLVVDTSEEQQILRATNRDQMTKEQVKAIIKSQASRKKRLAAANDIIHNDKDLTSLKKEVLKLHEKYLDLSSLPPQSAIRNPQS